MSDDRKPVFDIKVLTDDTLEPGTIAIGVDHANGRDWTTFQMGEWSKAVEAEPPRPTKYSLPDWEDTVVPPNDIKVRRRFGAGGEPGIVSQNQDKTDAMALLAWQANQGYKVKSGSVVGRNPCGEIALGPAVACTLPAPAEPTNPALIKALAERNKPFDPDDGWNDHPMDP